LGWIDVRITAEETPGGIIARVSEAWRRRTCTRRENRAALSSGERTVVDKWLEIKA